MRVSWLALAWIAGCSWFGGESSPPVDGPTDRRVVVGGPAEPKNARIREVGPEGAVPRQVVVRLPARAFADNEVGIDATERVRATVEPPVEGVWTASANDLLVFEPTDGFRPDTRYVVNLVSVDGLDGAIAPADGASWSREFTTPPLAFVRAALAERDPASNRLSVELVFSAPIAATGASERLRFRLDGVDVAPDRVGPAPDADRLRAEFTGAGFLGDGVLSVDVAPGILLASDASVRASGGTSSVALVAGKPMEIQAVYLEESATGFHVEVVCSDAAAGGHRYWWNRSYDGWWVSDRCDVAPEEVARVVHIEPHVAVTATTAPAGFRLVGDFQRGSYRVRIDAGATTLDGGVLQRAFEQSLAVGPRTPRVTVLAAGRYLPRSAWTHLPIQHLNVPAVEVEIRHVPPENVVFWLTGDDEAATTRTSRWVASTRIAVASDPDEARDSWIDVGGLVPSAERGVYEVRVRGRESVDPSQDPEPEASTDTGWHPPPRTDPDATPWSAARVVLTDLALVAKRSEPGVHGADAASATLWTWALGAHDNAPVAGVALSLVRPSGQSIGACTTDRSGGCAIPYAPDGPDDTAPVAVLARRGDDFTYLAFDDVRVEPDADVSGRPFRSEAPYLAAVYADRGAYRPGETAHVGLILRADDHRAPPATGVPTVLSVYDPRGRELRKAVVTPNAAGFATWDVSFASSARTGRYRVVASVADQSVGEASILVEEFVPERMAVTATATREALAPGDAAAVDVTGRWLFGGSANGSNVEVTCRVEPDTFRPTARSELHYGPATLDEGGPARRGLSLGSGRGRLDVDGRARVECPEIPATAGSGGTGRLVAEVAVTEGDSGRATRASASAAVHPAPHYVGVAAAGPVRAGAPLRVRGAVVDWEGELAPGAASSVDVEVYTIQEETLWTWDAEEQTSRYRRLSRRSLAESRSVPVTGGTWSFDVTGGPDGAGVIISARAGAARTELYVPGAQRRWWWGGADSGRDQTPRPAAPTTLAVTAPDRVRVGEDVAFTVRVPWRGRLLFTAETDAVLASEWRAVEPGEATFTWRVPAFHPNVYLSALLVKDPHLESEQAWMPDRAHGVRSVRIEPAEHTLDVNMTVPAEVRPNSRLDVSIDVGRTSGPTFVTVAAVDEGVLSLTDFESPDPIESLFARRALGVGTYETIGWGVVLPPGGPASPHGGSADFSGQSRVTPVRPVALWSGLVEVPADGRIMVPLAVPYHRGALRVMAVAASASRVGSAQATVRVFDPISVDATLPRFLVAGDTATLPVFVTNQSGRDGAVEVRLDTRRLATPLDDRWVGDASAAPVEVVGPASRTLELRNGASGTALFEVRGVQGGQAATLTVVARSGDLSTRQEQDLPIEYAGADVRRVTRVPLTTGDTSLAAALQPFAAGSDRSTVWVTSVPWAAALAHLRTILHYPHGCIEQTTSATRPLLYAGALLGSIDPELAAEESVDAKVAAGIDRVLSMQTPSGGFAYWPGGSAPDPWGSTYATHLLLDARDAGHAVPPGAVEEALTWLAQQADSRASRGEVDDTTAYLHYLLARAGRARTGQAARAIASLPAGRAEARRLLAAALYLGGDRRFEAELRNPDLRPISNARAWDRSYGSDLRTRGMALALHQELFGVGPGAGAELAALVGDALSGQDGRRYTTQELGWGMTGLGKWLSATAPVGDVELRIGGTRARPASEETPGTWLLADQVGADVIARSSAPGRYAVVATRGVLRGPPAAGGAGLSLSRALLRTDGTPLDGPLDLGDLAYVVLTVRNTSGRRLDEIALVDRVPAGWEIENPRLGGQDRPEWVDPSGLWPVEHLDRRDDRLEAFGDLDAGASAQVIFAIRAVTAGQFTRPPARAEAMYAPEVWARTDAVPARVRGPWDGS